MHILHVHHVHHVHRICTKLCQYIVLTKNNYHTNFQPQRSFRYQIAKICTRAHSCTNYVHESASDLHETLSAYCPHRGQQSDKFSASTEFPLSNNKNKAKFIDDVISGDHVIFRNFKHIRYTHRVGIYKTWGRSKLYLENCGQELVYQNVTPVYVYVWSPTFLHACSGAGKFFVKRARVLASTQI